MSLLDDIATQLQDDGVGGIAGGGGDLTWTIYRSFQPDTPDQVIVISELPGDPRDQTEGISYEFPGFQITVRAEEMMYDIARAKIDDIISSLNNVTISGFVYVFADTSPIPLGYDENQRPVIALNFSTMKQV